MPAETLCPVCEPEVRERATTGIDAPVSSREVGRGEGPGGERSFRARVWRALDSLSERAWPHAGGVAALVLLVLGLYWPVVGFDFVNWDDPWYVINNPRIRSWHPANLWTIATEVAIKNYTPLTTYSFLVDHTLGGEWPGGYHLTNWLLHGVNVVLVYFLIAQLTRSRGVGWLTAALFAVHPVHVESVAWISSRKGLLSAAFVLASLMFWLRPERRLRDDGYGLLFYVLALLSKAIAIVVPPIVFLYDVCVAREPAAKAASRQLIPGFLAVCLVSITMTAQSTEMGGVREHLALGKLQILAIDAIVVWRYIGMLVWPKDLCVLYDPPTSGIAVDAAVALLCWGAVLCLTIAAGRRWRLVPVAVGSFFLLLFPVLNFFPITTLMNDRYLYLPSIPVFALAAAAIVHLGGSVRRGDKSDAACADDDGGRGRSGWGRRHRALRQAAIWGLAISLVAGYATATWNYLPVWRNGLTLWRHAMEQVPQLPVVQIQMANALHDTGRDREAREMLWKALRNPRIDQHDRRRALEKLKSWQ